MSHDPADDFDTRCYRMGIGSGATSCTAFSRRAEGARMGAES